MEKDSENEYFVKAVVNFSEKDYLELILENFRWVLILLLQNNSKYF